VFLVRCYELVLDCSLSNVFSIDADNYQLSLVSGSEIKIKAYFRKTF
jgi:hypothetical protein